MQTATNIERFPIWAARAPAPAAQRVDWVCLGSEHDIAHIARLWQLVMRFRLEDLPDDESIMWQLSDKLRGRRSDIVRIQNADVEIDSRHLKDFRTQNDWLWDHLVDEHGEQRYQFRGTSAISSGSRASRSRSRISMMPGEPSTSSRRLMS